MEHSKTIRKQINLPSFIFSLYLLAKRVMDENKEELEKTKLRTEYFNPERNEYHYLNEEPEERRFTEV